MGVILIDFSQEILEKEAVNKIDQLTFYGNRTYLLLRRSQILLHLL